MAKVTFHKKPHVPINDAEECFVDYLALLFKNSQICYADYYYFWDSGKLVAYCVLARPDAMKPRFHSHWGTERLRQLKSLVSSPPKWELLEKTTAPPLRPLNTALFLYLAADFIVDVSPLYRGDDGEPIPLYLLPVEDQDREDLHFWTQWYAAHDEVWLASGTLEMAAYREMSDVNSELCTGGRESCRIIEQATGVPTFFYVERYHAKKRGELKRRCPGCGGEWLVGERNAGREPFHHFLFRCDPCRLVSHAGVEEADPRAARIGLHRRSTDSP